MYGVKGSDTQRLTRLDPVSPLTSVINTLVSSVIRTVSISIVKILEKHYFHAVERAKE